MAVSTHPVRPLLFRQPLSQHPALSTPWSSSLLHFQILRTFHELRSRSKSRFSLFPLSGLTFRRCKVHIMLRVAGLHLLLGGIQRFSTIGCPIALVACYVTRWRLPRPDFHRLAAVSYRTHQRVVSPLLSSSDDLISPRRASILTDFAM